MTRSRDVVLMVLVMFLSGNPSVYAVIGGEDVVLVLASLLLLATTQARGIALFDRASSTVFGVLFAVLIAQGFQFDFFPLVTFAGFGLRLLIALCVVRLVEDFTATYVRAMSVIAGYAIAMWTLDQLGIAFGIPFRDFFQPLQDFVGIDGDHRFSLIYTFTVQEGTHRNSGFFREPGLFAGYLLLALLFASLRGASLGPNARRNFLLLLLALVTTFSTAGYITVPIVLAAAAFRPIAGVKAGARAPLFIGTLAASLVALWLVSANTTFIEDKIMGQYEALLMEGRGYEITRFGSVVLDLDAIEAKPVLGWGLHESTKFALIPELAELSPSGGVSGWARSFGLVGLCVLLLSWWRSLRPIGDGSLFGTAYIVLVVAAIAQPNTFLTYPLYACLLFLPDRTSGATPENSDVVVPQS